MVEGCHKVVALLVVVTLLAAGLVAFADEPQRRLEIIFQSVENTTLHVGVHNPEPHVQDGRVTVVVTVEGARITESKPVRVQPHSTQTVDFTFEGSVRVISVTVSTNPNSSGGGPGSGSPLQDDSITEGPDPI
jgi:hypothetical protein